MQPPPINGVGGTKQPVIHAEDYVRASKLPVIIAIVATVLSVVLIFALPNFSTWINVLGYLLTPFLVIACAGIDSVQQRRKSATDTYFLENRGYSKLLRVLSGVSILISIPHINGIATTVAAWVAKL
jgi:purine-cytosine permease-like protein